MVHWSHMGGLHPRFPPSRNPSSLSSRVHLSLGLQSGLLQIQRYPPPRIHHWALQAHKNQAEVQHTRRVCLPTACLGSFSLPGALATLQGRAGGLGLHRGASGQRAMVATGTMGLAEGVEFPATKLGYFDDMWLLQAPATILSVLPEGDRVGVILDRTILYAQGGGQPCDTGCIASRDGHLRFSVQDVRSKSGVVYHYGYFDSPESDKVPSFQRGQEVMVLVDSDRRTFNSRLHTAGHLLDACMSNVGLAALEPGKGHHFPDGPFVEYKGTIPATEIENKRGALEAEANRLVAAGGHVRAVVAPYLEAAALCGGILPDYIPKESCPRVVSLGDNPGCPCGGTHVADLSEIGSINVTQIRVKKGVTKVSYNLESASA